MKKSLLAIAAMTAFAGAAQAQSSVTVYGILDVGFVGSHYNGTSASTANAMTTGGNGTIGNIATNASSAGFGQSAESTSRIGFKGSEDLGGGLSGIFTIETAVNPDSAASAFAFNRQTFVGLDKKGLGAAMVGTQYTPLFDVQSITDAAGNNNLVGNAVYSGNLQSSTGTYNTGLAPYGNTLQATATNSPFTSSLDASSGAYVTRASNALKIQSDRMAGLRGQAFYSQSNQSQSQTTGGVSGANNNTMFGFNADYIWNKLQVVAAYQSARSQNGLIAGSLPGTAAKDGFVLSQGAAGAPGNNMSENSTYGAATYDFGILKGYAQYITTKAFSTVDNNFGTSRSAYQLGARSQLTPTISVYATYGLGKSSYAQAGTAYANFRTAQLGSDYYLSKRTNLYVAYGAFNQSSNGATGATGVTGVSGMNYAAGVRHTF
jgi:predicted porin